MKRLSAALLLALYASSTLAAPLPSTVTTTTTSIPGNSSLLDDVIEATNARNNLKVVPSSQIGQTLVAQAELSSSTALSGYAMGAAGLAGLAYYQRTGKDPVYALYQAAASAADAIFIPGYQAFKANFVSPESYPASAAQYIGKEGSIGLTLESLTNLVKSSPTQYPTINGLLQSHQIPGGISNTSAVTGAVVEAKWWGSTQRRSIGPWNYAGNDPFTSFVRNRDYEVASNPTWLLSPYLYISGDWLYKYEAGLTYMALLSPYFGSQSPLVPLPASIDWQSLKPALSTSLNDPSISNEITNAVKNAPTDQKITSSDPNPSTVPAQQPSPITNNDVSNFFTANTTNVYNQYLNTVNNGGDVNTAQAAAELAKAQEEEAEKETEEKFNALDANPFQNPYNPGPFDIPTRFTTFLQNVKTSGLFSFSSAFFNSLPGGGSPLLTVNGGQTFGTHTFDFSQSLGGGLAILKSVLLALFGFLSIRAVIMKR